MLPLTKTQYETLEFMTKFRNEFGYMPSNADIAKYFDIVVGGSTAERINHLVKKGYVKKTGGPRGYMLIEL